MLAGSFVRLLLGDQWGEAVPIIKVLACAGAITAIASNNVSAYLALGRPRLTTMTYATRLIVLCAAVAVLYRPWGVLGIAYAELIAAVASMAVSLPILLISVRLRAFDYLRAMWRPLVASAVMAGVLNAVAGATHEQAGAGEAAIQLLTGVATGALVYPLVLAALWVLSGRPNSIEPQISRWALAALRARLSGREAA